MNGGAVYDGWRAILDSWGMVLLLILVLLILDGLGLSVGLLILDSLGLLVP